MPRKAIKPRKSLTPEVYQVEVITAARVNDEGLWEYHVKWAGYPDEDSWEPHENVKECDRLLNSFWDHIGVDNNDYPLGYQVDAKPKWIKNEMAFFAAEFAQQKVVEQQRRVKQAAKDTAKKEKQKIRKNTGKEKAHKKVESSNEGFILSNATERAKQTNKTPELGNSSDSQGSDDDKLLLIATKPKPSQKRRRIALSDDSDVSDPEPPRKLIKHNLSISIPGQPRQSSTIASTAETKNRYSRGSPGSPTSLFSERSSPPRIKDPLPKTSSKPQPKIKLMDIEPSNVASGSTLTTKQRIFQNATSSSKAKPNILSRKSSITSLAFKRNLPNDSGSRTVPEAKTVQEPLFSDLDISESPTSYQKIQNEIPHSDARHAPQRSPEARLMMSPPPMPPADSPHLGDSEAAENFLAEILPRPNILMTQVLLCSSLTSLIGIYLRDVPEPMPESISDEPVVPRSLTLPRPPPITLPKIPKKWKWVGDLFMDTAPDHAELLCTVTLSDSTDAPQNGLRLSIMFSSVDSIRLKRRLHIRELDTMLCACGPVQQLARLGVEDIHYERRLKSVVTYMDMHQQVGIMPLSLDDIQVAALVVFPSSLQNLWRQFKVPPNLQLTGTFLAALVPWAMTPSEYSGFDIQNSFTKFKTPSEFKHPTSRALQYLQFPHNLRTYMSQPQHTYCVWWSPGDGTTAEPGLETNLLHKVMKSCRAKNVGHKSDVRVVFVHIGAVKTLHRLPALAERRSKRPEIHFYTYGTHVSVSREQWGVRAIYPLGGIVTFTPDALLEDPFGAGRLMQKIAEHPLWDCYLLPSVVGMTARSSCEGADLLSMFKTGDSLLHNIMTLIAEGEVSLLRAPALYGDDLGSNWVRSQLRLFSLNASSLLEGCLNDFAAHYSNTSVAQLAGAVEGEISKDMLRMQTQPSIMESYRRFVVIKKTGFSETDLNKGTDGFEWTTLAKFDFKDDFFERTG